MSGFRDHLHITHLWKNRNQGVNIYLIYSLNKILQFKTDCLKSGNQELIKFSHNISKFIKLLAKRKIVEIIGQIGVQSSFCNQVEHNTSNLGGLQRLKHQTWKSAQYIPQRTLLRVCSDSKISNYWEKVSKFAKGWTSILIPLVEADPTRLKYWCVILW